MSRGGGAMDVTATLARKVARVMAVRDGATLRTTRARVPGYLSMIRCSDRSVWNDFPVPAGPLMMALSVLRNRSRMGPRISARTRVDLQIGRASCRERVCQYV